MLQQQPQSTRRPLHARACERFRLKAIVQRRLSWYPLLFICIYEPSGWACAMVSPFPSIVEEALFLEEVRPAPGPRQGCISFCQYISFCQEHFVPLRNLFCLLTMFFPTYISFCQYVRSLEKITILHLPSDNDVQPNDPKSNTNAHCQIP